MYDVKSEAKEFVAETVAEALAKAKSFFGIDESEITFRELVSVEVAGAAGRVVIVAQPTEMVGQTARAGGGDGRAPARERPARDRDRGESAASAPSPTPPRRRITHFRSMAPR